MRIDKFTYTYIIISIYASVSTDIYLYKQPIFIFATILRYSHYIVYNFASPLASTEGFVEYIRVYIKPF